MTSTRISSGASKPNGAGFADVELEDAMTFLFHPVRFLQPSAMS